jgi:hypothetical protein
VFYFILGVCQSVKLTKCCGAVAGAAALQTNLDGQHTKQKQRQNKMSKNKMTKNKMPKTKCQKYLNKKYRKVCLSCIKYVKNS